jgi:hypothetical protein
MINLSENIRIKLDFKSKFFKDELLKRMEENNINILHKKIVPHYKVNFLIDFYIRFTDSKKTKLIIKEIEDAEKIKDRLYLEFKRKELN